MEPSHPVRHRVGVVLVCLVALLTAREGWNLGGKRSRVKVVPATEQAIPRPQPQRSTFDTDGENVTPDAWRPGCDIGAAVDLTRWDLTPDRAVEADPDFVFALTPETFPLAAQFTPEPDPASATINPALLEIAKEIEPLQPDSYILWLPPVTKCRNAKKNSQGQTYCAPEDPVEVPEPASVALLLGGGAALVLSTRRSR